MNQGFKRVSKSAPPYRCVLRGNFFEGLGKSDHLLK